MTATEFKPFGFWGIGVRISKISDSMGLVLCAALLAGCSSWGGVVEDNRGSQRARAGTFDDSKLLEGTSLRDTLLGEGRDENRLPVNKYLWRASLDTLSFLPIASIDTFSGVIATDWGASSGTTNERVRVTTYVRDAELSATALDVSVFRETLSPGGVWQAASVDPGTARQLEDAILTRARQLRIQDVDG